MTPKQKAIEIVEKYEKYLYDKNTLDEEWAKCVECALISVDEILDATKKYDYTLGPNPSFNHYWLNVKKEMDKL